MTSRFPSNFRLTQRVLSAEPYVRSERERSGLKNQLTP